MNTVVAYIALGSNVGDSPNILRRAMERLAELSVKPLVKSSLWQTTPVNCPPGSPPFVNAVVTLAPLPAETPESLLVKLLTLEKEFGRKPKQVLNEPRRLDHRDLAPRHRLPGLPRRRSEGHFLVSEFLASAQRQPT